MAVAVAFHELDEGALDRQSFEWIDDLQMMLEAQAPPTNSSDMGIVLPDGVRLTTG